MLHPSITALYQLQRAFFSRMLRLNFAAAGVFWFILYALPADVHGDLRNRQSIIYLVLMSLWGLDYMREQRRLRTIINRANEKGVRPNMITAEDVADELSIFTVVRPAGTLRGTIMPLIFTIGLLTATAMIVIQYIRAAATFWGS